MYVHPLEIHVWEYGLIHISYLYMYMYMGVLVALFVCLTLLASFFLPSHLSFKNMYIGSL